MRGERRGRAGAVLLAVEPQGLRQHDDRVVVVGVDHALAQALVLRPLVAEVAAAVEQDDAVRPDRPPHGASVVAVGLALVGDVRTEQAQGLDLAEPDRRVAHVRVVRIVDQRHARTGPDMAPDGGEHALAQSGDGRVRGHDCPGRRTRGTRPRAARGVRRRASRAR
jgi:hypothetical protein